MTATNHVLTGCVFVALVVTKVPLWVVLPGAFLLHFVLDALPHFGQTGSQYWAKNLARLWWLLPADASVAASILMLVITYRPEHWLTIVAGGILCASPDLWSVRRYFRFIKKGNAAPGSDWFSQFHQNIQWGERLWGAWVELAWFVSVGAVLVTRL